MKKKEWQLPFIGGILLGIGLGLWIYFILAMSSFVKIFGPLGVIFIGLFFVIIGAALGSPQKKQDGDIESKDN